MEQSAIFQPMAIQAGLIILVGLWLVWARVGSVLRGKVNMKDVAENGWQGWIKQAGDNFDNQHQVPLLFFVTCFILYLTNSVTAFAIGLAWFFVISRVAHALVHLTFNHIFTRFLIFFSGIITLAILIITAARAVF